MLLVVRSTTPFCKPNPYCALVLYLCEGPQVMVVAHGPGHDDRDKVLGKAEPVFVVGTVQYHL